MQPLSKEESHAPPVSAVERPEGTPGDVWGHASLYLVFTSFVLFKAWQTLFDYPLSAEVILPGLGRLDTKAWSALINGLGGWLSLSAVVSLAQPGRFVRNLLLPLYAIEDEYIRKVFRNPVSFALSLLVFLGTVLIAVSNVAVEISTPYEIMACLPAGHDQGELVQGNQVGDEIRLRKGEPVRLLLRGWRPEILVIRDRYNLITLEALELRRSWLSLRFTPLKLFVSSQAVPARADGFTSIEKISPFRLAIRGPLSLSSRAVLWAVVTDQDLFPGRLLPGEPEDGPEDPPNTDPQVSLYFRGLWTARDLFATWTVGHQHHVDSTGMTVNHSTSDYVNRIVFKEGTVAWHDGLRQAKTKEVIFVIAKKPELQPTADLLASMPVERSSMHEVVGLRGTPNLPQAGNLRSGGNP